MLNNIGFLAAAMTGTQKLSNQDILKTNLRERATRCLFQAEDRHRRYARTPRGFDRQPRHRPSSNLRKSL